VTLAQLREAEGVARQEVLELRRAVFEAQQRARLPELVRVEQRLQRLSEERAQAEHTSGTDNGSVVRVNPQANLLGPNATGLDVSVTLRMAAVPTALVHLYEAATYPLVSFAINNHEAKTKRLRLVSYVEHYSARAVDTIELEQLQPVTIEQLPTFFPERIGGLSEMTRATLNVEVQVLGTDVNAPQRTEIHKTVPIWLLARSSAPLQMKDPGTGTLRDLTPFLGAFVTPNAPAVMAFLATAVDKHPQRRFVGYQSDEAEVTSQVRAIYEALAAHHITYINSIITFTPDPSTFNQRVRLPGETLANRSANCIDGTLLLASLLEAVSLNPAIVIIPGHAFLAWETARNSNTWRHLETTMLSSGSFDTACASGDETFAEWTASDTNGTLVKRRSLRDLRAAGITPRE
jgi:hypothetical protein